MSISSIEPPPELSDDTSLYNLRKKLFKAAMNRKWEEVVELYRDEKVQGENITRANDTLLHVAVSGATEKEVLYLLDIVQDNEEKCEILSLKNKNGDTPLHLAAALGLEKVCRRMTKMCPEMVTSARNNLHETPLFSAVRHGKKKAFFVLEVSIHIKQNLKIDEHCLSERDITHCRGHDGDNILHYAIKGEQFDLAYEIIDLYPALLNFVNSSGETALHTLANKPSVFKSGARFGLYDTIIYYCTITEPLKSQFPNFLENEKKNIQEKQSDILEDENKVVPPTYKVCIDIFSMMKASISLIFSTVASSLKAGIFKTCTSAADEENPAGAQKEEEYNRSKNVSQNNRSKNEKQRWFPPNYDIMLFFFMIIVKLLLVVLGIGLRRLQTITKHKQKHRNAYKIMKKLIDRSTLWEYEEASGGKTPEASALSSDRLEFPPPLDEKTENPSKDESVLNEPIIVASIDMLKKVLEKGSLNFKFEEKESTTDSASPVLIAAKRGITEMVKRILEKYPVAAMDKDKDKKNIVLLAVEHRQVHVYKYMLSFQTMESVFWHVDKDENSALHLAGMLSHSRPWSIPGAALQMQWESKWYQYVYNMNLEIFSRSNKYGKTPEEVFVESHDKLVEDGSTWLTNTSQSCSVVAALVATVAFASSSTVPGGVDQDSGFPVLSSKPAFELFAISSLVALCFSITSLVMFLAILTSRYQVRDFNRGLPVKLILGLTSLFMSIASMLVSFCAGDFFVVENKLKFAVYPIYAVMCLPVTFFAFAQFPLYIDLLKATIKKVPERTEKMQVY